MENKKKAREKKKRSFQLMDKGTGGWLCLIFFASAWMFILGIFVGRGTAPVQFDIEKLQKELVALKEAVIKKELGRFKIDPNAADSKTNLGFYEALKDTRGSTKEYNSLHAEISEQKRKSPAKKTVSEKTGSAIAPKKEKAPAFGDETVGASLPRRNSSDKKNEAGKNFTIQVASLKKPEAADRVVKKLMKKGYRAYITSVKIPGKGIWYRVRIGDFKTKAEAMSALDRLKKERLKGFIVQH